MYSYKLQKYKEIILYGLKKKKNVKIKGRSE